MTKLFHALFGPDWARGEKMNDLIRKFGSGSKRTRGQKVKAWPGIPSLPT